MSSDTSGPWLVKTSGRIVGPMQHSDVVSLMMSREVHILDEVASPLRRWHAIQDCKPFENAVHEVRKLGYDNHMDTTNITGPDTSTLTVTEPIEIDDATPIPVRSLEKRSYPPEKSQLKEIVYDEVPESNRSLGAKTVSPTAYAARNSAAVEETARSTSRRIWMGAALVAVGLVGYVGFERLVRQPHLHEANLQTDYDRGMAALDAGDYSTASDRLHRYHEAHPNDEEINMYLGPLMIQVDNQTVQGKQLLQRVIERQPQFAKEAWTGIGVAEMIDGHLDLANDAFQKALDLDSHYYPAVINLGILALQKQEFLRAKMYFESVVNKTESEPASALFLVEALINLFNTDKDPRHLDQASQVLRDFTRHASDYAQEAAFLALYLDVMNGKVNRAAERISDVLDRDPSLTDEHRHNLLLYARKLSWGSWIKWCQSSQAAIGTTSESTALWGYCLMRSDRSMEAKKVIENAVAQSPKNALLQALYSYVLFSNNSDDGASVALGRSMEYDSRRQYILPRLLQGQFCERQKDFECARKQYSELLVENPNMLSAIAGMARVAFEERDLSEVSSYLTRGLSVSSDYKPLRRLSQKAEAAGLKVLR